MAAHIAVIKRDLNGFHTQMSNGASLFIRNCRVETVFNYAIRNAGTSTLCMMGQYVTDAGDLANLRCACDPHSELSDNSGGYESQ